MTLPPGVFVESQLPADGAGFIDLELRGPRGAVVDVTCSEAQTRQARVRSLYNGLWQTDRLILSGRWDHWLSLDRRAGRYLCLCVRQSPGPVQVRRVALRTQHYPVSRPGTFQCSDWTLNRMWQAGAATVDASTFDLMEDCPTREKAQWAGDAFIRMHLMAWLWGDLSLSANAIREFARDQKPSRWARAMVPCGYRDVLVDTCFLLPRWAWDHYVLSGDLSVLKDSFQGVRNLFACAQTFTDRRGFVHPGPGGTVYVDYTMPPMSRCGDTFGALQAQYVVALEAAVSIAELLGKDGLARQWRKRADLLRQAIRDHFWVPAESLFVDGLRDGRPGGTFTAVTNYWMLFADVPTPEQERAMLRRLWPEPGREDMALWSRGESPYSKLYISEALLSRGLWRETLAQWRGYYGTMLRHPEAMSVFEMWNRSWPLDRPVPRNSLVHAFGIGPLSHLASRVAGVRPLQPGFGALLWEPMPLDLEWFSAELPLVGLDCTVHVEMQGEPSGGRRLVLTAPAHLKVGTSALYLAKGDTMAVQRTP
jgi:alpha-L-rhamnosidase